MTNRVAKSKNLPSVKENCSVNMNLMSSVACFSSSGLTNISKVLHSPQANAHSTTSLQFQDRLNEQNSIDPLKTTAVKLQTIQIVAEKRQCQMQRRVKLLLEVFRVLGESPCTHMENIFF